MSGLGDLLGAYGSEDEEDLSNGTTDFECLRTNWLQRMLCTPHYQHQPKDTNLTASIAVAEVQEGQEADRQPELRSIDGHPAEGPLPGPQQPISDANERSMEIEQTRQADDVDEQQQPLEPISADDMAIDEKQAAAARNLEEEDVGNLPPELAHPPPGECDPAVQDRVARWLDLQSRGRYLADQLRSSRDYRNPEFFRKMVEYWEIDQHGTAFNPEVFDPKSLPHEDKLEALQLEWENEENRRRTARTTTGKVEFTKGTAGMKPDESIAAAQARAAALAAAFHARR